MSMSPIPPNRARERAFGFHIENGPRGLASRILTAPRVFGIGDEIGEGRRNDPEDLLRAARGLAWAGYQPARGGLVETIKSFQADHGLEVDGWMRPGGPTARTLDETIAPKVMAWREQHPAEATKPQGDDERVAWAPVVSPIVQGALRAAPMIGTAGEAMRRQLRRLWDSANEPEVGTGSGRTDIANPPPPVPPSEPDGEKPDSKEEILPVPQEIPILRGRPINEVLRTDPLVFEAVSDELRKQLESPLESHRGGPATQWGNKRSAELCDEEFQAWGAGQSFKHVGGASRMVDGEEERLKEVYIENPATGRLGSSNADLSFEYKTTPNGQEKQLHLNTGRTLKDGETPIAEEARQLVRLKANSAAEGSLAGFLPKYRPGMDVAQWENRVRQICRDKLTEIFGPPHQPPQK